MGVIALSIEEPLGTFLSIALPPGDETSVMLTNAVIRARYMSVESQELQIVSHVLTECVRLVGLAKLKGAGKDAELSARVVEMITLIERHGVTRRWIEESISGSASIFESHSAANDGLAIGWSFIPKGRPPVPPAVTVIHPTPHPRSGTRHPRSGTRSTWKIVVPSVLGAMGLLPIYGSNADSQIFDWVVLWWLIAAGVVGFYWLQGKTAHQKQGTASSGPQLVGPDPNAVANFNQRLEAWKMIPEWYPLRVSGDATRIDVVGGTRIGHQAALLTIVTDCLQHDREFTVLDLTETQTASFLERSLSRAGRMSTSIMMPRDLEKINISDDPLVLRQILMEVLEGADSTRTRETAATDDHVLESVIACIIAPLTIAKILAGLAELAGDPSDNTMLSPSERETIRKTFGRTSMDATYQRRVVAIRAHLRYLQSVGVASATGVQNQPLRIVGLERQGPAIASTVFLDFIAAVLLEEVATRFTNNVMVVLGADRLSPSIVERLTKFVENRPCTLLLFYTAGLGQELNEVLGSSRSAVAFMRLGNRTQADRASQFLGSQRKLMLSQVTRSVSESLTQTASTTKTTGTGQSTGTTQSTSSGESKPDDGPKSSNSSVSTSVSSTDSQSDSFSESLSIASSHSDSNSWTLQMTDQNLVEPIEIQQLPHTAFILFEAVSGLDAERNVRVGDANPAIARLRTDSDTSYILDVSQEK